MTITKKTAIPMDTTDKDELLSKYTRKPYPALVKSEATETEESDETGYRALVEHREKKGNAPRFRIIDRTGVIYGCGYAYLLGWLYSPSGTLFIYTTSHIFTMGGKNLDKIEDALLRERVKELRQFNPDSDEPPTGNDAWIKELTVTSRFEG